MVLLAGAAGIPASQAQETGTCEPARAEAFLETRRVRARIVNDGGLFYRGVQGGDAPGYELPRGSGLDLIPSASIWMGGLVDGRLHFAHSVPFSQRREFWPGPIRGDGVPPVDCAPYDRLWSVSRDEVEAYERYGLTTADLAEWPTGLGAPTWGVDGNLVEVMDQPLSARRHRVIDLEAGERPAITGDAMVWWIMNDLGGPHPVWVPRGDAVPGPPLGVEVHGSAFGYNSSGAIGNATFFRLRIFNRRGVPVEQMYFGVQLRPSVGGAFDDLAGADSVAGLAYAYNADAHDELFGASPPAIGLAFFQGADGQGDGIDNNLNGAVDEEGERTRMSAAFMRQYEEFFVHTPEDHYGYMRGRNRGGDRFRECFNGPVTRFFYPADPPAYCSMAYFGNSGFDPDFAASTGPFRLGEGEPQEVVFGFVTSFGANHLDSVRQLKEDDAFIQQLADSGLFQPSGSAVPAIEEEPGLSVFAHPVPASDLVTLRYRLPQAMSFDVSVFDLLGRIRVARNLGRLDAGDHRHSLDVSGWPPGVYLVRFRLDHHHAVRRIVVTR